jgi:hypothetical protein
MLELRNDRRRCLATDIESGVGWHISTELNLTALLLLPEPVATATTRCDQRRYN